jgi:hypothetical protein
VACRRCEHRLRRPGSSPRKFGTRLSRLEGSRLRATWQAEAAGLLGLATFLHAAEISCSQRLGDITAGLQPGDGASADRDARRRIS